MQVADPMETENGSSRNEEDSLADYKIRLRYCESYLKHPNTYEKLTWSLAPNIWELEDVKKGLLCQFKELGQAYEALSDLEKRDIYDQYGEDALNEGMPGSACMNDPFDIFQFFLGGGSVIGAMTWQRRGEDVVHLLALSLEILFAQSAMGSKSRAPMKCCGCQGTEKW